MRVDPKTVAVARRVYELPAPAVPDFEALLEFNDGRTIAAMAKALGEEIRKDHPFGANTDRIISSLTELSTALEAKPADANFVKRRILASLDSLRKAIGADKFYQFRVFAEKWATSQLLN
jgi:hypothetical protein